ncbi:MAG: cytochrome P450 [Ktedonobacteraceae bacterium]|nr:cytochrome P450 [Ktedonobacteraceae bacterium]
MHSQNLDHSTKLSLLDAIKPEHLADPYTIYRQLRETDPVYWDEEIGTWVATRHAEIMTVLSDSRFSAVHWLPTDDNDSPWISQETLEQGGTVLRAMGRQMIFLDPPDHTRLRGLVSRAFTPRMVQKMRYDIQLVVDQLLDTIVPLGQMEIISDFAFPLPSIVIAQMLGMPPEDREQFNVWSNAFGSILTGSSRTPEELMQAFMNVSAFMDYFRLHLAERKLHPKDDVLQALVTAEDHGDMLSEEEVLSNCVLLLAAGHGTTVHLIANGLLALLRNQDQLQDLLYNSEIIREAVEELLRYDSPVQTIGRLAKVDLKLGGKQIRAGQQVVCSLGAANRDPAVFNNPDWFNLRRPDNRQMAFGYGIHYCLGAPLARLEGEIAFPALIKRLPNLRLAEQTLNWEPTLGFRILRELHVSWDH